MWSAPTCPICNNRFYWNYTNGGGSAYIFMTDIGGQWNIFNNLFANGMNGAGDVYIQDAAWPSNYVTPLQIYVYNNTFVTPQQGGIYMRWEFPGNGMDPGLGIFAC